MGALSLQNRRLRGDWTARRGLQRAAVPGRGQDKGQWARAAAGQVKATVVLGNWDQWGVTGPSCPVKPLPPTASLSAPKTLQQVEVPLIRAGACRCMYARVPSADPPTISDDMVCAGYAQGQKDACQVRGGAREGPRPPTGEGRRPGEL